jgi:hypothetical protein
VHLISRRVFAHSVKKIMDFTQACLNSDWFPEIFETRLLNVCDEDVFMYPICHPVEPLVLDFVVCWVLAVPTTSILSRLAAIGFCHFKLY